MAQFDTLWIDVRLATMVPGGAPYGTIEDGALGVSGGRIAFAGRRADLPAPPAAAARRVAEGQGRWITPGLVDCHTHLVFDGSRAAEFEQRLGGATYEEIARAGGGIVSTVKATRAASEEALFAVAAKRLDRLMGEGVTTVEIKSGYGLSLADELKQLRVARRLGRERPVTVRTTLLAAHALPPEYREHRAAYVDLVCDEIVPAARREGLADAVDAFCEGIAFTPEETARVFAAAARHGLAVKLHADQLSDLGGAALAARHRALSADHLEHTSATGISAMAASGTVAVLLPGAFYFLRETKMPPVAGLREAGVPMAIATDLNPGSSPALSLLLMLNLACTLFRLTPEEALAGVTRHGARALGLADRGVLAAGQRADFVLWDIERPADLAYWIGGNPCAGIVVGGEARA
jgi:imidazolonepropionase